MGKRNLFLAVAILLIASRAEALTWANVSGNIPFWIIPVTLTNSQSGATAANLQVKLSINSNTNTTLYAANLSNVNWQDGAGNILPSWLESGETKTSTASVYWINLGSNTIAGSGGTLTIYEVIYATSVNALNTSNTGTEPLWDGTYAHFDDGTGVFVFYDNFNGSSLAGTWHTDSLTTRVVSNGLTLSSTNGTWADIYNTSTLTVDGIVEALMSQAIAGFGAVGTTNGVTTGNSAGSIAYELRTASGVNGQTRISQPAVSGNHISDSCNMAVGTTYIMGLTAHSAGGSVGQANYGNTCTVTDTGDAPVTGKNLAVYAYDFNSTTTLFQWLRSRLLPPSSVLPSEANGTPTAAPTATPAPTPTATATGPTPTATPVPTSTQTATPTFTSVTITPTATPICQTVTPTATYTPVATNTPTATATATFTATPTFTATQTFTATPTFTPAPTPTDTATPSPTPTFTATATFTPVPTDTATATATFTPNPTETATATNTPTATQTATTTPTTTPTPTPVPANQGLIYLP